jgi:hypothetical protein
LRNLISLRVPDLQVKRDPRSKSWSRINAAWHEIIA